VKDTIHVLLRYPRSNEQPDTIEVSLEDVRAASSLQVKYDFDRDGWVIFSERLMNPTHCDACAKVSAEPEFVEVAFVKSWELEYCVAVQEVDTAEASTT
jgi:hypothetical protein